MRRERIYSFIAFLINVWDDKLHLRKMILKTKPSRSPMQFVRFWMKKWCNKCEITFQSQFPPMKIPSILSDMNGTANSAWKANPMPKGNNKLTIDETSTIRRRRMPNNLNRTNSLRRSRNLKSFKRHQFFNRILHSTWTKRIRHLLLLFFSWFKIKIKTLPNRYYVDCLSYN